MEKVSVIIPVYNVSEYLDECVESVVNQDYENLEIILVDDGSKDNSGDMCEEWKKKDDRIVVFHKENGGLSSARNYGMDRCNGKYIMFLDSDDFVEHNIVSVLYNLIKENDVLMSGCSMKKIIDGKKEIQSVEMESGKYNFEEYLEQMYKPGTTHMGPFGVLVTAWAKMYDRKLFDDIRYPEGKINEDNFIIHKLVYKAKTVAWVNEELYLYRIREGSITHGKKKKTIKELDNFYGHYDRVKFIEKLSINQNLKNTINYKCFIVGFILWGDLICDYGFDNEELKLCLKDIKDAFSKIRFNSQAISKVNWIKYKLILSFPKIYYNFKK